MKMLIPSYMDFEILLATHTFRRKRGAERKGGITNPDYRVGSNAVG